MNDITIRHCLIRVVRNGGWSWGPNRRKLLDTATRVLPELIAERLARLLDGISTEIQQPLKLRISLNLEQLTSGPGLEEILDSCIESQIGAGSNDVLAIASADSVLHGDAGRSQTTNSEHTPNKAPALPVNPVTALDLLLRWHSSGDLWRRLQGFSAKAAELWLLSVLHALSIRTGDVQTVETVSGELQTVIQQLAAADQQPDIVARKRLVLAVAVAARYSDRFAAVEMLTLLDKHLPPKKPLKGYVLESAGSSSEFHSGSAATSTTGRAPEILHATMTADGGDTRSLQTGSEFHICSALPFLVLGVLQRIGYIDVLKATLQAAAGGDATGVSSSQLNGAEFATALAYKVLPAPQRGWRRSLDCEKAAAVFSDKQEPPSGAVLSSFERQLSTALSPLDGYLSDQLASGHDPNVPLLITRLDPSETTLSWLLLDADGVFPVYWSDDPQSLLPILNGFGPTPLLLSSTAASPAVVAAMTKMQHRFITDAPPGRGERWQRLLTTPPRWTNDSHSMDGGTKKTLITAARQLDGLNEQAIALTSKLLCHRPVVINDDLPNLERSATLAATTGLGMLAWTLWGEREPVNPLLALERFHDLDASVNISDELIRVKLPLGRRYLDLRKNGLLKNICAAPWLGGRNIEFPGP